MSNTNSRTLPSNAAATLQSTVLPGCWVMPSTAATASGTAAGSVTAASSKTQTPSGNSSARPRRDLGARRVLPTPPTPVSVTNRCACSAACDLGDLGLASDEARGPRGAGFPESHRASAGAETPCADPTAGLETSHGIGTSRNRRCPRSSRSTPLSRPAVESGEQDLTAMPGSHHPRGTVQHRTEVVPVPQFGLAGRQPHPHRQLQRPLRVHRGIHRRPRRGERRAHPVAGVLEQKPPCASIAARNTSSCAASATRIAIGVGLPPTGRTLDIGEQKRHHPRRSSRPISGHPRRISQPTRSYLVHRRIRPGHRIHVF